MRGCRRVAHEDALYEFLGRISCLVRLPAVSRISAAHRSLLPSILHDRPEAKAAAAVVLWA